MANTASENAVSRFDMAPVEQMSKTDEISGGIDSAAVGTPPHVVCRPHEFITLVCSDVNTTRGSTFLPVRRLPITTIHLPPQSLSQYAGQSALACRDHALRTML